MSVAEEAVAAGLHRVGARPPLAAYLAETWRRRDFAITMARYRLAAANELNRLGVIWIVLRPSLNAAIYGFIFGLLQRGNRPPNYVDFVVIGVFLFEFFSASMNQGAKSITGNRAIVQSLAFPRITLPLSAVIEQFFTLMAMLVVMLVIVLVTGQPPRMSWFWMIPLIVVYTVFNTGVALICARLTVMVPDLSQLLPFVARILMYLSGVLWDVGSIFKGHPTIVRLFDFHPIHEVLAIARGLLLGTGRHEHPYPVEYWFYLTGWAFALMVFGVLFFWAAEERYGQVN
ncbi:MAG: ABC transporter permease [Propionibacteriaceae bacterium]